MNMALVSIIIPFKNTEIYISECIESILKQDYPYWEAIFVNDHSNDNSYNIVDEFSNLDRRIKILNNEGDGIIHALQRAYSISKGSYITRMDSDDVMTINHISHLLYSLQKFGKNHLAVGQVKYFREGGVSNGYLKYQNWINLLTLNGTNFSEIYKECVIPSPCWMLHRSDFEACDGFLPNRYPEDYDLTFRFYKAGFKVIPCSEVLLHWRDYSWRTSRTHEHYAQNYFLDIKVHYFLALDYDNSRPLTLWGAGFKGKCVARLLIKNNIPFYWICDNPKKIGKNIYGKIMLNFNYLEVLNNPQSIVTVANTDAQKEIYNYFIAQNMRAMKDYFFFC